MCAVFQCGHAVWYGFALAGKIGNEYNPTQFIGCFLILARLMQL